MTEKLSPRLLEVVDALPLTPGMRVLEIGCGPGAMARKIAVRVRSGAVLGIDRSAKAIALAQSANNPPNLTIRQASAEDFRLQSGEAPYDIAVAVRVGALDGRHPEAAEAALRAIAAALRPGGRLFIDGGNPLLNIPLPQ